MRKYLLAIATLATCTLSGYTAERQPVLTGSGLKQVSRTAPRQSIRRAAENVVEVPFLHALGKDSPQVDFVKANYKAINANNDSRTWNIATTNKYSSCMAAKAGESENADDWLITMPIHMAAGNYILKFDQGYMGASAKGVSLEFCLGTTDDVDGMTQVIAPEKFYDTKDQTSYQYDFNIAQEGNYYIGVHCTTSVADAGATLLYNIGVEKGIEAPANAIEVPFLHNLGKDSDVVDLVKNTYTTINANGDNRQWQVASVNGYSACMAPNADDVDANDDWFITPPIHMPKGNYTVAFDLGYMSGTGVTMEVKLGKAPTVEGMTVEIMPVTVFPDKDQKTYEYNCAISEDGYWYIGFHCVTTKDQKSAVKLFNIGVSAGETVKVDPPAAGELTWQLAPKGELKATVVYTAPTKTVTGNDLKEITKVEITSRWGVDKFTYDNVVPGQVITIENVEMYQGINNRFTGVAYVGDKAGEIVEHKSIFCGKDTPLAPTNVQLKNTDDFTGAILSWDPVGEIGENGGYVDPDAVTYYIFDAFGSYYDPAIATTDKTTYTITPDIEGQDFVAYQVTAAYEDNYSLDNSSNIVIVGVPAVLPFKESFTNGYYDGLWALDPATSYSGQQYGTVSDDYFASLIDPDDPDAPTPLKSFDGDNGFFYWLPYEKNVMTGLMSVRADISKATNPVLEYRYQGQGSTIDVLLAEGPGELKEVKSINLKQNPTTEWTLARIPLSEYKAAGAVNFEIRLTATHNDEEHTWSVPLDYICVRDLVDTDMRMVSATSSTVKTQPGSTVSFSANVQNQGLQPTEASIVLYINDEKAASANLGNLASDQFAQATLAYKVPLNAPEILNARLEVAAEGDAVASNNDESFDIVVAYAPYPSITGLEAKVEDGTNVVLTWEPPTVEKSEPQTIFEDFESEDYEPMTISGAGGWTVYDADKATTINVFYEKYNPYQTAPMAFQLFNREVAMVPSGSWMDAQPHSGNTFMLAPTSYYDDNDNWLISPQLSGNKQTISFYAKSFSIAWPESFEARYSTSGNQYTDFPESSILTVENYPANGEVPEEWTKYSVELPEGATYFAIRHTGWYTCALFVDDVTYEGMPEIPTDLAITGYHVMRDDVQLTETPIRETTYTDTFTSLPVTDMELTYSVIPVYNHGIARSESTQIVLESLGIETIGMDSLDNNDDFFTLQGLKISKKALTPGIYIKVHENKSSKVLVK